MMFGRCVESYVLRPTDRESGLHGASSRPANARAYERVTACLVFVVKDS
jgi:hypothetical protein